MGWLRGERDNQRGILIERATVGVGRNLVLGEFQRVHKDDPS